MMTRDIYRFRVCLIFLLNVRSYFIIGIIEKFLLIETHNAKIYFRLSKLFEKLNYSS